MLAQAATSDITGPTTGVVAPSETKPWAVSDLPVPSALPSDKQITIDVVYGIPAGFTVYSAHVIQAIGAKLGWKVNIIPATANTQQAALVAVQAAVLQKPTAIITSVVPGVWVGPALSSAKAAGIYTIDMHQDSSTGPGYDAWVPAGDNVQKTLLAAYAVSTSNGKAHTIVADAPGFSDAWVKSASSYLAGCSGCTTESVQWSPPDFTTPTLIQSDVTAELSAQQNVNYLLWPNGALPLQPVVSAIANSATNKKAKILANGAAPSSVSLVKSGQLPILAYSADALMPLLAIDDVSRLIQGKKASPEGSLSFPISYWTSANAPAADYSSITEAELKTADWVTPFANAWKVSDLKAVITAVKQ
jgi:ABC-type sugar transport system substrate-binding protein